MNTMTNTLVKGYVLRITEAWRQSVEKIIETGLILADAEEKLNPRDWMELVDELPITQSTITKLITIGCNKVLSQNTKSLPPYWSSIYEISTMAESEVMEGIRQNVISPSAEREQIIEFKKYLITQLSSTTPTPYKSNQNAIYSPLGEFRIPKDFPAERIDDLQNEIIKLADKFSISFHFDTSKKGIISLKRKLLSNQMQKRLGERRQLYNQNITDDELHHIEHTLGQLRFDKSKKRYEIDVPQQADGTFHQSDIKNSNHSFHGNKLKDIYDYCRENKILINRMSLGEIDKEARITQLIQQHCDGDAKERSNAKKTLKRMIVMGEGETPKMAQEALDMLILGNDE